jgi:predicted ester cyclase
VGRARATRRRPARTGLAGLKYRVTAVRQALPDLHLIVKDQIADADRVVTRITVRGTHQTPFLGPRTHRSSGRVRAIDIDRIGTDGRIVEHWAATDTHALLVQLGALSANTPA